MQGRSQDSKVEGAGGSSSTSERHLSSSYLATMARKIKGGLKGGSTAPQGVGGSSPLSPPLDPPLLLDSVLHVSHSFKFQKSNVLHSHTLIK